MFNLVNLVNEQPQFVCRGKRLQLHAVYRSSRLNRCNVKPYAISLVTSPTHTWVLSLCVYGVSVTCVHRWEVWRGRRGRRSVRPQRNYNDWRSRGRKERAHLTTRGMQKYSNGQTLSWTLQSHHGLLSNLYLPFMKTHQRISCIQNTSNEVGG